MRSLLAAVAFMTRLPVPASFAFDAKDVGRAARWFPLMGALLGGLYAAIAWAMTPQFPAVVTAVIIVLAEALATGALHLDGLADTADGFGGGHTREDVLRIMRDHAIGSYGAVALCIAIALKVTAVSALIGRQDAWRWLILAPALGRWSIVALSRFVGYARESSAVSRHIGTAELVWATATTAAIAGAAAQWRGALCWALVAAVSACFARYSVRKIGGITGDTLGANVQISECTVLLAAVALTRAV